MIFDSCQIDDEHSNHKHHNIKVSEKRFNELIQTQNFKKAMEKIPKIKKRITDNFGRTVMEDQYGFSIIDAPIKTTESENTIAYNILINEKTRLQCDNLNKPTKSKLITFFLLLTSITSIGMKNIL